MFQGINSKKLDQNLSDLDKVHQSRSYSGVSDQDLDELYEERVATKKIDITKLANSLATIYKTKSDFG